jgi:RNA-binding protein Musashi
MDPGKLFIGGISWDTNEDRLRSYFQNFGDVVEAVIMKDRTTGRARGFGFVVFSDPSVAERVVMEKHVIDGRTVSFLVSMLKLSLLFVCTLSLCDKNELRLLT